MLTYLLQGISLGLSAAASPGPFQAFLIGRTLKNGWRSTLPAAFAPLISDGPIILLMTLLLTNLPAFALRTIQIVGGAYVLYLAWRSFLTWKNFTPAAAPTETGQTLWQAVVANLLSPGPYIFWSLLAGPVLVKGWRESPSNGISFLLGFYGTMICSLLLLVILFSAARKLGGRVNRALTGVSSLALLGFGLYQIIQGLT